MTPTLIGRLQSRIFLTIVVGIPWTLIVVPFLAAMVDAKSGDVYRTAFTALALVGIIGLAWEFLYQQLQQYRWEKDWPALFGLVTIVNEFIVVAIGLKVLDEPVNSAVYLHFLTLWLLIWFVGNGPLRIVLLRWRFRGGRII